MSAVLSSLTKPKPKRSRKKLYWIIGIILVIGIAGVVLAMAKKREKPTLVTTDKAFRKTITQSALNASQFDIQRSEGALRQINEALSKTTIVAPSSGSISSLSSRLGERVVGTSQFAGTEVMRIADLTTMEARVNVNENDIVNVKIGYTARISVD